MKIVTVSGCSGAKTGYRFYSRKEADDFSKKNTDCILYGNPNISGVFYFPPRRFPHFVKILT